MTTDLAAFLRARLDEDEQTARAAFGEHNDASPVWTETTTGVVSTGAPGLDGLIAIGDGPISRHIVNWHPGRALAEVDAKRRIIAEHPILTAWKICTRCSDFLNTEPVDKVPGPCPTPRDTTRAIIGVGRLLDAVLERLDAAGAAAVNVAGTITPAATRVVTAIAEDLYQRLDTIADKLDQQPSGSCTAVLAAADSCCIDYTIPCDHPYGHNGLHRDTDAHGSDIRWTDQADGATHIEEPAEPACTCGHPRNAHQTDSSIDWGCCICPCKTFNTAQEDTQ